MLRCVYVTGSVTPLHKKSYPKVLLGTSILGLDVKLTSIQIVSPLQKYKFMTEKPVKTKTGSKISLDL